VPHELRGGGEYVVSLNRTVAWPNGRHSMCGDRWDASPKRWMQPRQLTAVWREGATITLHIGITTNHMGPHSFLLCPPTAKTEADPGCIQLQRADGAGPRW
jgi:hypothetical protein